MIGCGCAVCRSPDPRDRRLRTSVLVEIGGDPRPSAVATSVRSILVDTSTDLRAQALRHDVRRVDAILYTHSHADHVMGLDDIRPYNSMQKGPIACFGDGQTLADIARMFAYIFHPATSVGGAVPRLTPFRIAGVFSLGGVEVVPGPLLHGRRVILGYRFGRFAYLTDCSGIPDRSWPLLDGVRVLVLDALRDRPHPTHFSVAEALDVVARLAPEHTYFTHICHDLPHEATCARLPEGVELAYDGLVLEIRDDG